MVCYAKHAHSEKELFEGGLFAIEHDILDRLSDMVLASSQTQVAGKLGISVQYLGDMLHGRRRVSNSLARKLGWERKVVFIGPV